MTLIDGLTVSGSTLILLGVALDANGVVWAEVVCVVAGAVCILAALAITFFQRSE